MLKLYLKQNIPFLNKVFSFFYLYLEVLLYFIIIKTLMCKICLKLSNKNVFLLQFTCELPHSHCKFNVTELTEPILGGPPGFVRNLWCPLPEYIPLSCILGFLTVAMFLRLPVLVKMLLLLSMGTVYCLLIFVTHLQLFTCYNSRIG